MKFFSEKRVWLSLSKLKCIEMRMPRGKCIELGIMKAYWYDVILFQLPLLNQLSKWNNISHFSSYYITLSSVGKLISFSTDTIFEMKHCNMFSYTRHEEHCTVMKCVSWFYLYITHHGTGSHQLGGRNVCSSNTVLKRIRLSSHCLH